MKKKYFRSLMFTIGMILNSFGIYLVIVSALGTHPIDAIAIKLCDRFGFTIGTWLNINSLLMVLIAALIAKSKIRYMCFFVSVAFGFLIDFWSAILFTDFNVADTFLGYRIILFVIGLIINSIGIVIYMSTNYPISALDNMMISIKERTGWPLSASRLVMEGVLVLIALLLSGPIGVGSFVIIFVFSYMIDLVFKLVNPIYSKIEKSIQK